MAFLYLKGKILYNETYDDPMIRSTTYSCMDYFRQYYADGIDLAIDMGCGTCRKIIPVASEVGVYEAIDESPNMLGAAANNISSSGVDNIMLTLGCNLSTPYSSHSADLVSCFLSVFHPAEAHRVLRKNGRLIVEVLDARDKAEFKVAFGADRFGDRGIYLNMTSEEKLGYLTSSLDRFFDISNVEAVEFETHLQPEGVIELLYQTPTVRGFDSRDHEIVHSIVNEEGLVSFIERRILISAVAK